MLGLHGFECFIDFSEPECRGSERRPLSITCWVAGGDLCPPSSRNPGGLLAASLSGFSSCDGIRGGRSTWWDETTQTQYERSRKKKKSQVVQPSRKCTGTEGAVDLKGLTATGEMLPSALTRAHSTASHVGFVCFMPDWLSNVKIWICSAKKKEKRLRVHQSQDPPSIFQKIL